MKESEWQDDVIALAKLNGFTVAHFRPVRVQRRDGSVYYCTPVQGDGAGFPDLLMIRGERMLVAELKVGYNKPSLEQSAWLDAFRAAGVEAYVWYPKDWDEVQGKLERYGKEIKEVH